MGIIIGKIRISNFRSLESIDLNLGMINILIGQNNGGKSNLLKALDIALGGTRDVSEDDLFRSINEKITQDKIAIIDIMIRPTNESNNEVKEFSDFWIGVFSETWIATDETKGDFVGVRTTIEFDMRKMTIVLLENLF